MADVAGTHTIIETEDHIGIYEISTGSAQLVKEYATGEEAEALMDHERQCGGR